MSESVSLPALGESVTEGTVTRWLKNVGDRVEVDEPLLEVSTDKVDTEIPSPVAGVIEKILVQEDETVEVGTALVEIGDGSSQGSSDEGSAPEAEAPAAEPAPAEEAPAPVEEQPVPEAPSTEQPADEAATAPAEDAPEAEDEKGNAYGAAAQPAAPNAPSAPTEAPAPVSAASSAPAASAPAEQSAPAGDGSNSGYVTPLVRRLAQQEGVDLSTVSGTGVGGRIRKEDVLEAAKAKTTSSAAPAAASTEAARKPLETSPLRGTTQPMSRLRKVVAQRAVESMQSSAQLTSVVEVDVTKIAQFRDQVKGEFHSKTGNKLSFLPFFALAATEALKAYPVINATIDGDQIVYPDHENLSIAVDTERGLLTPVIRDASSLDLNGFATQIADLAARTRDNKLKPDELAGGTFTLTNTGSRGALFDTPVVFLPQVAILGTGIVTKKPVVISNGGVESIAIRSMVYLALSYDHRIVDGADASRFLVAVKNRLEDGNFQNDLGI
ncbi:2-oxoglutarate dehydrogenase, E2 component, dihydrolipoamide succinyltransferase [Okibacterium fritillariae]|uniref:Dihydrolipoamide acetyltransferase component of pyruvate dehydrogenase complex n=1 Tax=Okibacterium fritillariae TaxID=123320 RepID=A0A1T5JES6_9MICO|nr:2-oxoglutarate dehydrogenase, E2 component, dihydrolipoamide succinyltransferase [Okibacterium fritillariae]SKC49844.1 2-oxoglutarate dehydrogenase E2 component [Okibacterium fritillariae]